MERKPIAPAEENPSGQKPEAGGKKNRKKKPNRLEGMKIFGWTVTGVAAETISWVLPLLAAVIAALVIRSFVFEPVRVDGASMNDTLANGEVMFVSKWNYASTWLSLPWQDNETKESAARLTTGFGAPKRFDVVICRYPGRGDTNFVKRLIGMPGDRVSIADGYLYVNGEKQEETYITDDYRYDSRSQPLSFPEVRIPQKGDTLTLDYTDETKAFAAVYVNGEKWPWRGICSEAEAADGDLLAYREGVLYLNGEIISGDPDKVAALIGKEFTLKSDLYFVMGDHRNNSNDSRAQGPISRDMLIGQVRFVILPPGSWREIR